MLSLFFFLNYTYLNPDREFEVSSDLLWGEKKVIKKKNEESKKERKEEGRGKGWKEGRDGQTNNPQEMLQGSSLVV